MNRYYMVGKILILMQVAISFNDGVAVASDDFVDEDFNTNINGTVNALVIDRNEKILVGGTFSQVSESDKRGLARLSKDGILDSDFTPDPGSNVNAIATTSSNGNILIAGGFTNVRGGGRICCFARLRENGNIDITLNNNLNSVTTSVFEQDDGGILVGLFSTRAGGINFSEVYNGIVRVNSDNSFDINFDADINFAVSAIYEQEDGKILVGGAFDEVGEVERVALARLNSDGSLDIDYNANIDRILSLGVPNIHVITQQDDGKILIAGTFRSINGLRYRGLARLNSDGTLDLTFKPSSIGLVDSIAIQDDGKILIGGLFSNVDRVTRNNIARLNSDGTLDFTFNANANGRVRTIAIDSDGGIIIGGDFTSVRGVNRNRIARLEDRVVSLISLVPQEERVAEGNSGVTRLEFEVERTVTISGIASIDYAITGRRFNPTSPNDFNNIEFNGTINFSDNQSAQIVTIEILGDLEIEEDENFTFRLFNPVNSEIGNSLQQIVVSNDDFDNDLDGITDSVDNCNLVVNSDQINSDGDEFGDACDEDDDNDFISDGLDNCPLVENQNQLDNDLDAMGDVCDEDDDNDLVKDIEDNCQFDINSDQADNDNDLFGDVCDLDDDGDGVIDEDDNCPFDQNADQADVDDNEVGDACEQADDSLCMPMINRSNRVSVICI